MGTDFSLELRSLTKRSLVDRAIAALVEIESREGRGGATTAIIASLLDYGHQYDAETDKCVDCGGTIADHSANYYCAEFIGRAPYRARSTETPA